LDGRARAVLWFAGWALCADAPAAADATLEEAARHFEEGTRLYIAGRYQQAIDEFEAANAIAPAPANLFNLARCHEKLGEFRTAFAFYDRYLADADAPDREVVERRVADLRAMPVDLFVSTSPVGARVVVDDAEPEPDRTPSIVRLRPGRHVLRIEREGHLSAERTVELRPLTSARVHLDLVPRLPAASAAAAEPAPVGIDPATVPSVLEEIRTRRDGRALVWRLSVALGAAKYDRTAFILGADVGAIWRRIFFNLHWFAMTSSFSGQVLAEGMWDVPLEDLDLFVGAGAGATQVRSPDEGGVLPTDASTSAFVVEAVGGIDFFLRKQLALGMTLRLQVPIDEDARAAIGEPDDNFLLVTAAGHVTLQL
jgi:hypothetical protein